MNITLNAYIMNCYLKYPIKMANSDKLKDM